MSDEAPKAPKAKKKTSKKRASKAKAAAPAASSAQISDTVDDVLDRLGRLHAWSPRQKLGARAVARRAVGLIDSADLEAAITGKPRATLLRSSPALRGRVDEESRAPLPVIGLEVAALRAVSAIAPRFGWNTRERLEAEGLARQIAKAAASR